MIFAFVFLAIFEVVTFFIEQALVLLTYKLHYMLQRKLLGNFLGASPPKTPNKVLTAPIKPPVAFIKLNLKLKTGVAPNA